MLTKLLNINDNVVSETAQTERLIKQTAKQVFFQKGLINATTQEIADEAGVNRALIHYYFRSCEHLRDEVYQEAIAETRAKIQAIFDSPLTLRQKISRYLDVFIDRNLDYPYIQNFIITEVTKNPERTQEIFSKKREGFKKNILPQLNEEIANGTIAPISLDHFMTNLMSMCSYPLIAKPIIQNVFGFDNKEYRNFMKERKRIIYRVLFNEDPEE
jgi:TetR/AcrR family transcriptional regulator